MLPACAGASAHSASPACIGATTAHSTVIRALLLGSAARAGRCWRAGASQAGAHAQDGGARFQRGDAQRDLAVEAAGAPQRRVQRVRAVGRACPGASVLSTAAGMPAREGLNQQERLMAAEPASWLTALPPAQLRTRDGHHRHAIDEMSRVQEKQRATPAPESPRCASASSSPQHDPGSMRHRQCWRAHLGARSQGAHAPITTTCLCAAAAARSGSATSGSAPSRAPPAAAAGAPGRGAARSSMQVSIWATMRRSISRCTLSRLGAMASISSARRARPGCWGRASRRGRYTECTLAAVRTVPVWQAARGAATHAQRRLSTVLTAADWRAGRATPRRRGRRGGGRRRAQRADARAAAAHL